MWYSVSLFFESQHSPTALASAVWEGRIVLIEAIDEATAIRRAEEYGRNEQHSYPNQAGGLVSWRFDSLDRIAVIEADKFTSGLELFSRFLRASEVASLKTKLDD